jgi:hypothetical protein
MPTRKNNSVFAERLHNYVFQDNRRRHRDDRVSLIIAFAFSGIMLALGQPERTAALWGLAILGVSMFSLTVYYCNNAATVAANRSRAYSGKFALLYRPVSRRLALLSGAALLLLTALPEAAASVIDRKLRRLTTTVPLDQTSLNGVVQNLRKAEKYRLNLSPSTINTVVRALRETTERNPALSAEVSKASSAAASASTFEYPKEMQGKVFKARPLDASADWGFSAIATNTGPDNYLLTGWTLPPNVAIMEPIQKPVRKFSGWGPAFLVAKGLTARLDGFHLKNVIFEDMRLSYDGGPLILENVCFYNCMFHFGENENCWRLIVSITSVRWVNFNAE